jgi:spermidine synthase
MRLILDFQAADNRVQVIQDGSIRKLLFIWDKATACREQGAINVEDLTEHIYDFSLLGMYSLLFVPNPQRILVLGLGAGVIPREMRRLFPDTHIDIIEIDETIRDVAKNYFFFEEDDKMKVHFGDAFVISKEMEEPYDIICADAFNPSHIPFHLMSVEFIRELHRLSSDRSVVAANCSSYHPSLSGYINTYREVFGDKIYRLDGLKNHYSSTLYICKGEVEVFDRSSMPKDYPELNPYDIWEIDSELTDEIKNTKIFTLTGI